MAIPLKPIARRALAAQSDDRLVRLLREGHEPAFDEVVRRYRAPLVAFAGAIAGTDRAEDVVQTGLIRAHRALTADEREIRLRPWLFAIVRNGALNAVRDEPAWSELDPELHGDRQPPATAEQREELERLVDAICALPEPQRRALVMREMEGVGHAEIAATLETTPTAVRGLIFRARTTVRNALGALVPLPVMRWLLEDAAVATAAAAGAGGGGALVGGTFGKAAVGLTTAVVAVGAGIAIDHRRSEDDRAGGGPETARAATGGTRSGSGGGSGGRGPDGEARPVAEQRDEGRHEGDRDAGEETRKAREAGGDDRTDDHPESSGQGDSSGSEGSGGHPGGHSGSGDDDDFEEVDDDELEEVDDDDRAEVEEPEIDSVEPEEVDVDEDDSGSSGSGHDSAGDDPDDD